MLKIRQTLVLSLLFFLITSAGGQTTGKFSGKVIDEETKTPLVGANIVVQGTSQGAATDEEGYFFIINIKPGTYQVRFDYIGYQEKIVTGIRISPNKTTEILIELSSSVLEGEVVTVVANQLDLQKDRTGSVKNISSDQLDALPIDNVGQAISMQAGVVSGHFRGGRLSEVTYLIDGLRVDDTFGGVYQAVDLEPEVIENVEVITGTFSAEYGRAMSGVVNLITKDGSNSFNGSLSYGGGGYYTNNSNIFKGLDKYSPTTNKDTRLQLSGPIIKDRLFFMVNGRLRAYNNHLNGIRRFQVSDLSSFYGDNPEEWYSEQTGDSSIVAMDRDLNQSIFAKLTFSILRNVNLTLSHSSNSDTWRGYDHAFKYNPDGMGHDDRQTHFTTLNYNHMLSSKLFYDLRFSRLKTIFGSYLYEDPLDENYVHDRYLDSYGPGFFTGGQQKHHVRRYITDLTGKFDLTWQANKSHSLKFGIETINRDLDNRYYQIRNKWFGSEWENVLYEPDTLNDSTIYSDVYTASPKEFAAYVRDKMEFNEWILDLSFRYDSYAPNSSFPSDRRNPANQLDLPDSMMSAYDNSTVKSQISPRLEISYQLSDQALVNFGYGHFFEMPADNYLYQNHSFLVPPNDYSITMGNTEVKAQKTVQYQMGLWQKLQDKTSLQVTLFGKDTYNYLTTMIYSTYNQIEYGLYGNKDYGSTRGLELKVDYLSNNVSAIVNYTLQYVRGSADYPEQTFNRAGDSMDPVNRIIPLSWDQRHTFNASFGYNWKNLKFNLTSYFNSGAPYTFSPIQESQLYRVNLYPNNDYMPQKFSVDFRMDYSKSLLSDNMKLNFSVMIFNLLDMLNEEWVNSTTGRAYTAVIRDTDIFSHRSDFNTFEDRVRNPAMYSAPRQIKFNVKLEF